MGLVPLQAGLDTDLARDQPGELNLEARCAGIVTGIRRIRRIRADAEEPALLDGIDPFVLRCLGPRRPDERGEGQAGRQSHSNSPNTVNVPPIGSDFRYCSFGSSPIRRSPVTFPPPVTTATYCVPPTPNVIGGPVTGAPRLNSHNCLPPAASSATSRPSWRPTKTRPPPVATVPPAWIGAFV